MGGGAKYLSDKSVFKPIFWSVLWIACGVVCCVVASEWYGFVVGLIFVLEGAAGVVKNVLSCCWYPVVYDKCIVLEHYVFPSRTRVIRYEDVRYMRVRELRVRRFGISPVLTVGMKGGRRYDFTLMTDRAHIGELSREILGKGVPDRYDIIRDGCGRKVYCSRTSLVLYMFVFAILVGICVLAAAELAGPVTIVLAVLVLPSVILGLNLLSYVVIDGGHVMLKYMVFRSRNLDISMDDVQTADIGPGGHFSIVLKAPDSKGKSRYTRVPGLLDIGMIQEINACLENCCENR